MSTDRNERIFYDIVNPTVYIYIYLSIAYVSFVPKKRNPITFFSPYDVFVTTDVGSLIIRFFFSIRINWTEIK